MLSRSAHGYLVLICLAVLWTTLLALNAPFTQASESEMRLRLKNGDFILGTLVPATEPGNIAVKCHEFDAPLEYPIHAVNSIELDDEPTAKAGDQWLFVLRNNSSIVGQLQILSEETVTVQSPSLGQVSFPRSLLSELIASGGSGRLLFVGPRQGQKWESAPLATAWTMEAGSLITSDAGSPTRCDAELTNMCEVRLLMSWSKRPKFQLQLATGNKRPEPGDLNESPLVRLETWDKTLTMIREVDNKADFVSLGELSSDSRLNLTLYLDQREGKISACTPTGKLLGSLSLKGLKASTNRTVSLLNANTDDGILRLERIDVREWSGRLPNQASIDQGGLVKNDGEVTVGSIQAFNASTSMLSVKREDNSNTDVALNTVARATFGNAPSEPVTDECAEVLFADKSSCVGIWKNARDNKLEFQVLGFATPLDINMDQIIGVSGSAIEADAAEAQGPELKARRGLLESERLKLSGCLSESSNPGELHWQASGALSPVKLLTGFEGKVVYQALPRKTAAKGDERARARARRVNVNGGIVAAGVQFLFGGAQPRAEVVEDQKALEASKVVEAGLNFRSGDSVRGDVEQIDERGVTFTLNEEKKVVPHEKMDSVTLVARARITELPPEKLKQLLTVPRASKADPPTHLFVAANGDYLRGRLVKYGDGKVTAEIRLSNVEFPPDAIAQIYWLHTRDWDEKKTEADKPESNQPVSDPPVTQVPKADESAGDTQAEPVAALPNILQVHAIQRTGKAITFTPTKVEITNTDSRVDQLVKGNNELLGDCEINVSELSTLLIGRDVGSLARKLQNDVWKLSVATLPKVYQEGETAGESGSPLVGKPAPDFSLTTATDGNITLSKLKGRVVVLDFWASWCGPCMQTMPEVDRIVGELGDGQVDLVAVNLQESKDRALAALKRLELSTTVALDDDGEVAQQYQAAAIPQTVIIDRQGEVTHVFVGGGSRFLDQFKAALIDTLEKE